MLPELPLVTLVFLVASLGVASHASPSSSAISFQEASHVPSPL